MVERLVMRQNHQNNVSKSEANGSTYHPFISGQKKGTIGNVGFGFMCYNNSFF